MTKKLLLSFAILAASALANAKSFSVTLFQPSIVGGSELQPGEYKLDLNESKVVIHSGKKSAEADVKVENGDQKFSSTTVRYQLVMTDCVGQPILSESRRLVRQNWRPHENRSA
jgi:hypothetical protein